MNFFSRSVFALLVSLFCAQIVHAEPRGIFVAIPAGDSLPTATEWQVTYVSGFLVPRNWSALEATRDSYVWSDFDTVVADAATYGKQVMLGIKTGLATDGVGNAGTGLPAWYTGATYTCDNGDIGPLSWDAQFQREYRQLVRDLILRYDGNPVVVGYALSGWQSWAFVEMSPPCRNANTANDRAGLIAAGYTRAKIRDFALDVLRDVRQLTRKPLRIGNGRMIDEQTAQNSVGDFVPFLMQPALASLSHTRMLLAAPPARRWGAARPRSRFAIAPRDAALVFGKTNLRASPTENTSDPIGLWNSQTLTEEERLVFSAKPRNFWQAETPTSGGPNTQAEWFQAVDVGLHYGMQFLEVRRADVVNAELTPPLQCAQTAMLAGGGHCGH